MNSTSLNADLVTAWSILLGKFISVNPYDIKLSRSVFAASVIHLVVESFSFSFLVINSLAFQIMVRASDSVIES